MDGPMRVNTRVPREKGVLFNLVEEECSLYKPHVPTQLLIPDGALVMVSVQIEFKGG